MCDENTKCSEEVTQWEISEAWEERVWDEEKRHRDYIVEDWLSGVPPQDLADRYF